MSSVIICWIIQLSIFILIILIKFQAVSFMAFLTSIWLLSAIPNLYNLYFFIGQMTKKWHTNTLKKLSLKAVGKSESIPTKMWSKQQK